MSEEESALPRSGQRRTVVDAVAMVEAGHLVDLSLAQLRGYRERLREEEERISYWRRLIHARVDLIDAERLHDAVVDVDALARVLGDTGSGRTRAALHRVRAADPLPELPDLAEVWATPGDPEETEAALARLRAAEQQLTHYRAGLHDRIDEATAELIVRYRADPSAALAVLV